MKNLLFVLFFSALTIFCNASELQIKTKNGVLEGSYLTKIPFTKGK